MTRNKNNDHADSELMLPQDVDGERRLLGYIMLDSRHLDYIASVIPAESIAAQLPGRLRPKKNPQFDERKVEPFFFLERHQEIFGAALAIFEKHGTFSAQLVAAELQDRGKLELAGGAAYIAELYMDTYSESEIPALCARLADKWKARCLIQLNKKVNFDLMSNGVDFNTAFETVEQRVLEFSRVTVRGDFVHVGPALREKMDTIEKARAGLIDEMGLSTGFEQLDAITLGLRPGNMIVLAARTSIGKTALAMNIAANVALGKRPKPVAIQSLEMSKDELLSRLIAAEAQLPLNSVLAPRKAPTDVMERIKATAATIEQAPIFLDDDPGLTMRDVRARARRIKNANPDLALYIVDYLQLIRGDKDYYKGRYEEVTEVSHQMKMLAKELKVPVIVLCQMVRDNEKNQGKAGMRIPRVSDLRDTGAIEEDADLIMLLHRQQRGDEKSKEKVDPGPLLTYLIIGKQRNGRLGMIEFDYIGSQTQFVERK